jgi:hypothetical protein
MYRWFLMPLLLAIAGTVQAEDTEEVFSGPQPGEELPAFKVQGVFDDLAGQELDFVTQADGGPLLLIFVHQVTRPSASVTRMLARYAAGREDDGLDCGIVWLTADRSAAEEYLKLARPSLAFEAPVGISIDGAEGPGSLGLNRQVELTILVANEGKVTANFAIVQSSPTEVPAMLEEVVKLIGGEVPSLESLQPPPARRRP